MDWTGKVHSLLVDLQYDPILTDTTSWALGSDRKSKIVGAGGQN